MKNNKEIKTLKDWPENKSFSEYVKAGDFVDEEMYNHFLNLLSPIRFGKYYLQVGEAFSHVNGKPTFATFQKEDGNWVFKGHCYIGETTPATSIV